MEIKRAKYIADLSVRYYIIREKIKSLRNSINICEEYEVKSLVNDPDYLFQTYANDPCFSLYHKSKNVGISDDNDYLNWDDMCDSCTNREEIRIKVNKLSLEGASLKRKLTWEIKKEIKENNKKEIPVLYETSDLLFELIIG